MESERSAHFHWHVVFWTKLQINFYLYFLYNRVKLSLIGTVVLHSVLKLCTESRIFSNFSALRILNVTLFVSVQFAPLSVLLPLAQPISE
jgi:hypothetical protein